MSIRNMMIGGAGARKPDPPTSVSATATGSTTADVSFSAPAENGGAAITGYTVTSSPGGVTATGSSSPITVTGLSGGTAYTFTVTATNAVGTSDASSPSASITTTFTGLFSFSSFTFTSGGITGQDGPNLGELQTAYNATPGGSAFVNNGSYFAVSDGIQNFTIPGTGTYRIQANGAGMKTARQGGRGARMQGDFSLSSGEVIRILVGQQGGSRQTDGISRNFGGGAAGGTFVTKSPHNSNPSILVIAGGGGGGHSGGDYQNNDGGINAGGRDATDSTGRQGSSGQGGGGGSTPGDPGGGFFNPGSGGSNPQGGGRGYNQGGRGATDNGDNHGGFGGGGASGNSHGGGGGGYSGGAGSDPPPHHGGGGGSYNNGSNQVNDEGINPNNGSVVITRLT